MKLFIHKIGLLIALLSISAGLPLSKPTQATTPETEPSSAQNYHPLET